MNWKLVVIGGLVFYIVMFLVSFITGPIVHNRILNDSYRANESFWRPELNEDPPDMAALMPRWITTGLLTSFVMVAIFGAVRSAFRGPGWRQGLLFGLGLAILTCCMSAGWSGVFNLPSKIWIWWSLESFAYYLPAGAVLGWLGDKLAPQTSS